MHDSSSVERTLCAATVQQRGEACANNRTEFLLYLWFKLHKYCIDVADWLIESLMRILFLKSSPPLQG